MPQPSPNRTAQFQPDEALIAALIDEHERFTLPRLERLWRYYRNNLAEPDDQGGSVAPPAQHVGLPSRLIGAGFGSAVAGSLATGVGTLVRERSPHREIVIENDIAWRIHTLVDFMFPAAPRLRSLAVDASRRGAIEDALQATLGDLELWQNATLLGSVYGHVDFLVELASTPPNRHADPRDVLAIHVIEAPRIIGVLNPRDYRVLDAAILRWQQSADPTRPASSRFSRATMFDRLKSMLAPRLADWRDEQRGREPVAVTEVHTATRLRRYENELLVEHRANPLGVLPIVHVQNLAMPLRFAGLSDVEPLIPLQDELNTRLSDRANRVTMQSFRMWLGKGIDNFFERPIGPGQMWTTDNPEASIEAFGGDADSPSERQHIEELREALDKASGVTPAAAGHIKARVGNLTSENALRISLMGTLAKINRKRVTYGHGLRRLAALVLHALDVAGVLRTAPEDRRVEIDWPEALPDDQTRKLEDALRKVQLGVPLETLRAELGYAEPSPSRAAS